MIQSDRLRVGKPTFIAFVDLGKAFDNVSWPNLFDILKNKGMKYKDRRIISSLYRDQRLNLYSEEAIDEIKEEIKNIGIKFKGKQLSIDLEIRRNCSKYKYHTL